MFFWSQTYDLTRHFKIWFSKNPEVALGVENELRLIRWRVKNPNLTLSLMVSSACLTPKAYEKLKIFCDTHRLQLVDFDTEVLPALTHPSDIEIFHLAKQELEHVRTNSGGNLAAASDLARMILPVLQTYGIYCDLDSEITMLRDQQTSFQANTPVILLDSSAILDLDNMTYLATKLNNAVVMIPKENHKTDEFIRKLQAFLIDRYKLSGKNEIDCQRYHFIQQLMIMTDHKISFNSIFECRRLLEHFIGRPELLLKEIDGPITDAKREEMIDGLEDIYMETVTQVSGPGMWRDFIYLSNVTELVTQNPNFQDPVMQHALLQTEARMFAAMHPSAIDAVMSLKTVKHKSDDFRQTGDLSWTFFGASNKQARDARLTDAAKIIQRAWRKNRPRS